VIAVLVAGWLVALALAGCLVRARRRLRHVADAEHELRGALTAFGLGVEAFARTAAGGRLARSLESELARARAALADLAGGSSEPPAAAGLERLVRSAASVWAPAARGAVRVHWPRGVPGPAVPAGPVAQVLGNLMANAVEHGEGAVELSGTSLDGSVRLEVSNRAAVSPAARRAGRGRGLRIARAAARSAGGRLTVDRAPGSVTAVLELPAEP
jgi:two-component system sensor histidine kinase MtrB